MTASASISLDILNIAWYIDNMILIKKGTCFIEIMDSFVCKDKVCLNQAPKKMYT